MIKKNSKIFIAGHKGMIGSAILKKLISQGYKKLYFKSKDSLDLRNQTKVKNYLKKIRPHAVILAAAKVGGIEANNLRRGEFIYDNIAIQNNVIHSSYLAGVKNLIFLGSSCVYPKFSKQPIKEKYLLSGYLEKTNEPYAIAKIAGINLCQSYNMQYNLNYKSLMPCNAYGINDNYNPEESHFFPALIKKISDSIRQNKKNINIWGDGTILREVIYADDVADASVFFLKKRTKETIINIGTGTEKSINDYAKIIMKHFGVNLKIIHQKNKLTGTPRKILDVSVAKKYGWKYKTSLKEGISVTIDDYLKKYSFK
tara:strand:+ start:42565 stop:43503 length:939 start_codon:yes stop_codon:yes gene_type:complete